MTIKLGVQVREPKEKLNSDFIPGVLYGKGRENQNLKIKKTEFDKVFKSAGESNLIDLDYGTGAVKVLIKDTQRDVMKNFFTHVDFYQVNMKEKIMTEIPLHFIGESKAIKELGGVLIKDMSILELECLPGDLVDHIDVDISVLKTFDDTIRINDLKLPSGMSLVHHTNEMIAAVREPKVEAEPEPTPAAVEAGTGTAPVTGAASTGEVKKETDKK
ncbi:MAG: 50S ribosomal protein L25 [Patescibacteria group bacterium]|jgi:large subunit ribosomal protein L25